MLIINSSALDFILLFTTNSLARTNRSPAICVYLCSFVTSWRVKRPVDRGASPPLLCCKRSRNCLTRYATFHLIKLRFCLQFFPRVACHVPLSLVFFLPFLVTGSTTSTRVSFATTTIADNTYFFFLYSGNGASVTIFTTITIMTGMLQSECCESLGQQLKG